MSVRVSTFWEMYREQTKDVSIQFFFLTVIKITRHDILKTLTIYRMCYLLDLHLPLI